jgi:hypothetical protein
MSRTDNWLFSFVSTNVCGWTDKFQLFQFSFSSVAYSQVSLSVRTEVPTKKEEEKNMLQTNDTETQIRSEVIH